MTNDTTQKNNLPKGLYLCYLILVGILIATLLVLVPAVLGNHLRSAETQPTSIRQGPAVTGTALYMMEGGWDGYNHVFILDPETGEVSQRFEAGYNAAVKLTADRQILYIYEQSEVATMPDLFVTGVASATDTQTGAVLWRVDIPGSLFGSSIGSIWLSSDEQHLFLQGNPGIGVIPQIFVVDTRTGTLLHDFELHLPYPSNEDMAFPLAWKLPWTETLVVASRDQLFTFDLTSGQTANAIQLFSPDSIQRVPLNLPHTAYVHSGAMDPEKQRLLLATSTQEILAVDLEAQPFTIQSVVSLPQGWQFGTANPLLLNPKDKTLYIQVKRADTPIINGLEVDEVWVYETSTWSQKASLNLREQLMSVPSTPIANDPVSPLDLTNYGLALSPDGQAVYSIIKRGLLKITQASDGEVHGTWLNIIGDDPESFAWRFVLP